VNVGTLKGVELKNMKVPFALPECNPHPRGIAFGFHRAWIIPVK
jgi:hypothetical protein